MLLLQMRYEALKMRAEQVKRLGNFNWSDEED